MSARSEQVLAELNRILPILSADPTVLQVFLFGSLAQSQATTEWSDLDLCVIQSTPMRFLDRTAYWLLKLRPTCGMDLLVYTPAELEIMQADSHSFFAREVQPKSVLLYAA